MTGRVVEVEGTPRHLSLFRGFMVIAGPDGELGRVVLDDIDVVVIAGHGATCTTPLLVALAERGAGVVLCGAGLKPAAWLLPVEGHHRQGARMLAQTGAGLPLRKQLWRQVVQTKVRVQGEALRQAQRPWEGVAQLAAKVRSGDPENVEAQAARRYWPLLLGEAFRRDREGGGANALLNYGYAILRSAMARSVAGAGLHPSLGIFHRGPLNPLNLADDLLEPYRPLVDLAVLALWREGDPPPEREQKERLAGVLAQEVETDQGFTRVRLAMERTAISLAHSFEEGKPMLEYPLNMAPFHGAGP